LVDGHFKTPRLRFKAQAPFLLFYMRTQGDSSPSAPACAGTDGEIEACLYAARLAGAATGEIDRRLEDFVDEFVKVLSATRATILHQLSAL